MMILAATVVFTGFLTARGIYVRSQPSWVDGGFGRLETGAKSATDSAAKDQEEAQLGADWTPTTWLRVHGHGIARRKGSGLIEAYVDLQKDFGATSLFGGGGYLVNPGTGNRDVWQAGLAVTHQFSDKLSAGTELTYQTRDTVDGSSTTGANIGLIRKLTSHAALLLAGGPSVSGGQASYHSYAALALYY